MSKMIIFNRTIKQFLVILFILYLCSSCDTSLSTEQSAATNSTRRQIAQQTALPTPVPKCSLEGGLVLKLNRGNEILSGQCVYLLPWDSFFLEACQATQEINDLFKYLEKKTAELTSIKEEITSDLNKLALSIDELDKKIQRIDLCLHRIEAGIKELEIAEVCLSDQSLSSSSVSYLNPITGVRKTYLRREYDQLRKDVEQVRISLIENLCDILRQNGFEPQPTNPQEAPVLWMQSTRSAIQDEKLKTLIAHSSALLKQEEGNKLLRETESNLSETIKSRLSYGQVTEPNLIAAFRSISKHTSFSRIADSEGKFMYSELLPGQYVLLIFYESAFETVIWLGTVNLGKEGAYQINFSNDNASYLKIKFTSEELVRGRKEKYDLDQGQTVPQESEFTQFTPSVYSLNSQVTMLQFDLNFLGPIEQK